MKTYKQLWKKLCTIENLEEAYWNARKHKTMNPRIKKFDEHYQLHIVTLFRELRTKTYEPKPLRKFVLRDPKTRTICVSDFRDRIVHHALVNVLHPIFDPRFIADSFASRVNKGTLPALKRFDVFKRRVTKNGTRRAFVLKCDIKKYFENVNHETLVRIIRERINDQDIEWIIRKILNNYETDTPGTGMPLGNWTSQFFANIYLDKLDQFVKHDLEVKHYIRYVDDFVILHESKRTLEHYLERIKTKLEELELELHPNKCAITPLDRGASFLGFRVFQHHKLVRVRNRRKIERRIAELLNEHAIGLIDAQRVLESLRGWSAYAMHGNTYKFRKQLTWETERQLMEITVKRLLERT